MSIRRSCIHLTSFQLFDRSRAAKLHITFAITQYCLFFHNEILFARPFHLSCLAETQNPPCYTLHKRVLVRKRDVARRDYRYRISSHKGNEIRNMRQRVGGLRMGTFLLHAVRPYFQNGNSLLRPFVLFHNPPRREPACEESVRRLDISLPILANTIDNR
jgi:hypothetical protein